jgi:hypothetical protein
MESKWVETPLPEKTRVVDEQVEVSHPLASSFAILQLLPIGEIRWYHLNPHSVRILKRSLNRLELGGLASH